LTLQVIGSGSGGAGKMPSPKNYFAGSRRIPASGEAAVRCNTSWQAGPTFQPHELGEQVLSKRCWAVLFIA